MGSGIADQIFRLREGIERIFSVRIDGKYQHLHALQPIVLLQRKHLRPQVAQILRHQADAGKLLQQGIDHLIARRFDPFAFHRRGAGGRDFPEGIKGPEVIDADDIEQLIAVADPVHPELIAVLFQIVPVIDRIAPPLSGGAEIIRRHAGDEDRSSVRIQKEVVPAAPYIHGVHAHIEGHVAHDADSRIVCRLLHLHPLGVEQVLQKHLVLRFLFDFRGKSASRFRPVSVSGFPFIPASSAVLSFQGAENGIIVYPFLGDEALISLLFLSALLHKSIVCRLQVRFLKGADCLVIHPVRLFPESGRKLGQQSLLLQRVQADVQLISRAGGIGLIGRIAVSHRIQRQDLPDFHSVFPEQVNKMVSLRSQLPHSRP